MAQPDHPANNTDVGEAAGAEGAHGPVCMQCGSSETSMGPTGITLCDECEMLYVLAQLEPPVVAPRAPGAALQARLAAPDAAPPVFPAAPPALAHPQAPAQPTGPRTSLGLTPPALNDPTASFAANAGGSAELGAPVRSSEEQAAATAVGLALTPQPPSVSPPLAPPPLAPALAPALAAAAPPAFLPVLQPPAATLPLMMQHLLAAGQAPPPAPPALPLGAPQVLVPPSAHLLSAAAAAHASMVEAQAAEAQLRAAQAWAALLSVPVVNPAMFAQLQQLPMPNMPLFTQLAAGEAAMAFTTAARIHQLLGLQHLHEQQAQTRAEAEAAARATREATAREATRRAAEHLNTEAQARSLRDQAAVQSFYWHGRAPPSQE